VILHKNVRQKNSSFSFVELDRRMLTDVFQHTWRRWNDQKGRNQ